MQRGMPLPLGEGFPILDKHPPPSYPHPMRERFLRSYARWVTRNAKYIAIGAFVLAAIALTVSILFLKTQTGILDLYSEKEPVARRFMEFVDKFGAAETLVIVVEGKDETQMLIDNLTDKPVLFGSDLHKAEYGA